ncbi:flagellar biosynthetic protein FliR [Stieleria sp. JC731]|uniref:flagellar biosynthetic protein FliR n=1 Tax=Pirellulaceae TaxID=2691357 RepID=UPI001E2D8BD6|nr:flagellar biosynthetic protein FliR [Stieleria sp. JC731]MCC9599773.1 flagellar biosynthetic protein FliR [Stieleria sp. JC731]
MFDQLLQFIPADALAALPLVIAMIALRLTGLILAMPGLCFGIPIRMRIALIALMTFVLAPSVLRTISYQYIDVPSNVSDIGIDELANWLVAGSRELILGIVIGGIAQLLISGMQLAGELISSSTGMQLAAVADPSTGTTVPQFSKLIGMMVTCLFLASGGHRILVNALLDSFQQVPPMATYENNQLFGLLIEQLTIGFRSGLRVAAPLLACIVLSNVVVALISRAIPGLNVIAVGININLLAALVITGLTIGSAGLIFESELTESIARLGTTVAR